MISTARKKEQHRGWAPRSPWIGARNMQAVDKANSPIKKGKECLPDRAGSREIQHADCNRFLDWEEPANGSPRRGRRGWDEVENLVRIAIVHPPKNRRGRLPWRVFRGLALLR